MFKVQSSRLNLQENWKTMALRIRRHPHPTRSRERDLRSSGGNFEVHKLKVDPRSNLRQRDFGSVEAFEDFAQSGQARDGNSGGERLAQRFKKKTVQLERLAIFEIDDGGRFVRAHRARASNLNFFKVIAEFESERAACGNDFANQFAHDYLPIRIRQKFVGCKTRPAQRCRVGISEPFL